MTDAPETEFTFAPVRYTDLLESLVGAKLPGGAGSFEVADLDHPGEALLFNPDFLLNVWEDPWIALARTDANTNADGDYTGDAWPEPVDNNDPGVVVEVSTTRFYEGHPILKLAHGYPATASMRVVRVIKDFRNDDVFLDQVKGEVERLATTPLYEGQPLTYAMPFIVRVLADNTHPIAPDLNARITVSAGKE